MIKEARRTRYEIFALLRMRSLGRSISFHRTVAVVVLWFFVLAVVPVSSWIETAIAADPNVPAPALPMLSPPTTPEESRAIRDGFSWATTRPVPEFRGPNPTLYYALIYIENESGIEALEDLQVHWDTVPLFAEERDLWIEQSKDTTPIFDGEGGFVFAVIPGVTFNLLREAVLCQDPEAVNEVLQVIQLRQIPVPEARESDGSLSYQFLATEGFQYRGLPSCAESDPSDPESVCASESETLQILRQPKPNPCVLESDDSDGEVSTPFGLGLGKRFKRLAARTVRFIKAVSDQARRGLSALERLFKGSVALTVTLETLNTDPTFGGPTTTMRRAWGASAGGDLPLSGVQIRVYQTLTSRFRVGVPSFKIPGTDFRMPRIIVDPVETFVPNSLATGRANDNGIATIRVVKNTRSRVCVRAENAAARVVNWVFPKEACAPEVIEANRLGSDTALPARISNENINVLAQATEGRAYMQDLALRSEFIYRPKKAEIMVDTVADVFGRFNDHRPFAACFGFPNWRNPYSAILGLIGELGGEKIGPLLRRAADHAAEALDAFGMAADRWAEARLVAAGTSAEAAINSAADAVNAAKDLALRAAQAAAAAAQAGRDVTEAAEQLLRAQKSGARQSVINAASTALERAVADANVAAMRAKEAQDAVARAAVDVERTVQAALEAVANAEAAAIVATAAAVSKAAADLVPATGEILARGVSISAPLVGRAAGELLGLVSTDILDTLMADVDLVFPSGSSKQSRGVATHEYGHFIFCDMMYRTSPFQFGSAWTDIIANTVAKQALKQPQTNDEDAYINEAFADFFASRVAGGVNYFFPKDSHRPDAMSWCATGPGRCIEDNFGAGTGPQIPGTSASKQESSPSNAFFEDGPFRDNIARIATILHDAFDPDNKGAWTLDTTAGILREPVGPIPNLDLAGVLHEESVGVNDSDLLRLVPAWLAREPLLAHLRESSFLGGLTQLMTEAGNTHDEICRLYILHQPNDICPTPPVGPEPEADLVPFLASQRSCEIRITVENRGGTNARASLTVVSLIVEPPIEPGVGFQIQTPPIPAGGAVDLPRIDVLTDPARRVCFQGCDYTITVDSAREVDESNEGNNFIRGQCTLIE